VSLRYSLSLNGNTKDAHFIGAFGMYPSWKQLTIALSFVDSGYRDCQNAYCKHVHLIAFALLPQDRYLLYFNYPILYSRKQAFHCTTGFIHNMKVCPRYFTRVIDLPVILGFVNISDPYTLNPIGELYDLTVPWTSDQYAIQKNWPKHVQDLLIEGCSILRYCTVTSAWHYVPIMYSLSVRGVQYERRTS
jgi:hypothetical protein